jgi:hypothetical protein
MRTEIVRKTLWLLLSGAMEGNGDSYYKKEREMEAQRRQAMEPNPPAWPATVKLIRNTEDAETIMAKLKETEDTYDEKSKTYTTSHHFSDRRWAVLFEPGIYKNLDFKVGYYVQVAGLPGTIPGRCDIRRLRKRAARSSAESPYPS